MVESAIDESRLCVAVRPIEPTGIEPTGIEPTGIEPTGIEPTGIEPTGDGAERRRRVEEERRRDVVQLAPARRRPRPTARPRRC